MQAPPCRRYRYLFEPPITELDILVTTMTDPQPPEFFDLLTEDLNQFSERNRTARVSRIASLQS